MKLHYFHVPNTLNGEIAIVISTKVPFPVDSSVQAYIYMDKIYLQLLHTTMASNLFKLCCLIFFLSSSSQSVSSLRLIKDVKRSAGVFPPTCDRIECPKYDVIEVGNGFEIRRYNYSMWTSTSPIDDISFVEATRTGFLQLFDYIQGKNEYKQKIEMTAPVITQVSPSDGPFCASSFTISFYLPSINQADPPPAQDLHVQKWTLNYAAVRQFSGFVSDSNIGKEAAALHASLKASSWSAAVDKGQAADPTSVYTVAQYNSPFEFSNRVNEIWMMFDMKDVYAA